jgi:hypothetical protein
VDDFLRFGPFHHAVKPPRRTKNNQDALAYRRVSSIPSIVSHRPWLDVWRAKMCLEAARIDPAAVDLEHFDSLQMDGLIGLAGGHRSRELGSLAHTHAELVETGGCTLDDIGGDSRVIVGKFMDLVADLGLELAPVNRGRIIFGNVEVTVVDDSHQIAGKLDRIYTHPDRGLVVADLKTGRNVDPLECAIQIAAYAGSRHYSVAEDGRRGATLADQGVSQDWGLVLHVPLEGRAHARWVDLAQGREGLRAAMNVLRVRERAEREGWAA